MKPFSLGPEIKRVAVATSGGPDSLALTLLARDWCRRQGIGLVALTVDHGLRPESAVEADQVRRWLERRRVEHHVVRWRGKKPRRNRQAMARAARYRLIGEWCDRRAVGHVLLGHQLEDQAETFLLRLGRGSGVDGLSAMAPATTMGSLRLLRPLLSVPRARLIATLRAMRQPWLEDPSNRDLAYRRSRARQSLQLLAEGGLATRRIAGAAAHLRRAREALEFYTGELLRNAVRLQSAGYCELDLGPFRAAPREIGLRALARVLMSISGAELPPRLVRLERLYDRLVSRGLGRGATLHGCLLRPWRESIAVCRELSAIPLSQPIAPGQTLLWDNRHLTALDRSGPKRCDIKPLGRLALPAGLARPSTLPEAAFAALPALARGARVLAVPELGFYGIRRVPDRRGKAWFRSYFAPRRPLMSR
jgi:tRNA(Ile)-lysidine synthase